jgi:hypothetical protein
MKNANDPVKKQLDLLLAQIAAKKKALDIMQQVMAADIERVTAQFKPAIGCAEDELRAFEAELLGLAKYHKHALFERTERLDLKHGALLRTVQRRVRRIKGMLERLKQAGRVEAVKVAESVDWERVEQYPDSLLTALGTQRVARELFAYEIGE